MKDCKKYIVKDNKTIREAVKLLDQSGIGFIVVSDANDVVVGVVSDGDFRRSILKGISLDENVMEIVNRNFRFLNERFSNDDVKKLFANPVIRRIPILKDRKLVDVLKFEDFVETKEHAKIKKVQNIPVVIMAGGKGTRLEPFTKVLPKPLIPVGEKAIVDHIMDEFKGYGINEFYFTLNYKGEMIKAYLGNENRAEFSLHFINEKEYLGSAGSLSLLDNDINENFIVTNCDIIVKADYASVLKFHRENDAVMTVISSLQHYKIPYGVIDFQQDGQIVDIIEKPENSFTINTGVYIVNRRCLKYIPQNTYFDMNTLISILIADEKKVLTYPVNESEYIDIGQWEQFRQVSKKIQQII